MPGIDITLGVRAVGVRAQDVSLTCDIDHSMVMGEPSSDHLFPHGDANFVKDGNRPRQVQIFDRISCCTMFTCMTVCTGKDHVNQIASTLWRLVQQGWAVRFARFMECDSMRCGADWNMRLIIRS